MLCVGTRAPFVARMCCSRVLSSLVHQACRWNLRASLLRIVGICPDRVSTCLSRRSTRSSTDCAIPFCSGRSSDVSQESRTGLGFFCRSSAIGYLLIAASFFCLLPRNELFPKLLMIARVIRVASRQAGVTPGLIAGDRPPWRAALTAKGRRRKYS